MKKDSKLRVITSLVASAITFAIIMFLYKIKGFAPFGELSMAWTDANIQYLDLWAYFKDFLNGGNNILYTFSKTLGGSGVAVLSYYLSSPFMLLVLFFEHADMNTLFDLMVALKLATAACTCSIFLYSYFNCSRKISFHTSAAVIFLSVSYALCQYSIAQASNVMWLDGVYMLPLILLGVHKIAQGKKSFFLSATVALSIIFNWYTAGINCLFSIIWMIYEVCVHCADRHKYSNAFEYLNQLYSQLLGERVDLFIPVNAEIIQQGNVSSKQSLVYSIELLDGNYAYYGNLPWNRACTFMLDINASLKTGYSC